MKKKKIAILGGGNGSHMMAVDMKVKGHEVRMYEMPEFKENVTQLFNTQTIEVSGIRPLSTFFLNVGRDIFSILASSSRVRYVFWS